MVSHHAATLQRVAITSKHPNNGDGTASNWVHRHVPAAATVFGRVPECFPELPLLTNLTSLTLDLRRRALVISNVFLGLRHLQALDVAFSDVLDARAKGDSKMTF